MKKLFSWTFVALVLITTLFASSIVGFVTDWWWFSEVGFNDVFLKTLNLKATITLVSGLFAAAFLLSNFLIAIHTKVPWIVMLPKEVIGTYVSLNDRIIKKITIIISILFALFVALIASASWEDIMKFLISPSFGQTDPVFGKDLGFYVFALPVYSLALTLTKMLIFLALAGCGLIYVFQGSLILSSIFKKLNLKNFSDKLSKSGIPIKQTLGAEQKARIHIGILLFFFFTALALSTYLSMYELLLTQNSTFFGATFTDAHIVIPLMQASIFVSGATALLALLYGITGKILPIFGGLFLTVIISFASGVIPPVFQKLIVAPNELAKETPYIKYNIAATRQAYGLQTIEKQEINADKPLTAADIAANDLTIKNVRLWDRDPLLSTFSQIQEIRTYYEFASVDNDRYTIDGQVRQIMLSPRELSASSLPNRNWINEHLTFTHGYGIAAGPVNQVTPEGLPVLFVKDLPPKSEKKELSIKRPEMYYGELVNEYVIVKSNSKEFDYPKGEDNVYTTYLGKGGVELNSPLKRLFYALQFNSLKMLLSTDITSQSRILYTRNVEDRVKKIAPFLTYDNDPYLVVADGKLYWIIDAYTVTNNYPYSQQAELEGKTINYARNTVKAVVDTYDGTVTLYQTDSNDPIINAYAKMFPTMFRPFSSMPKTLAAHIRYPEDIFSLQTSIYTTYHMDDPQIFYNKEDQWEIPAIGQQTEQEGKQQMDPRHMIMKLPNGQKEEYILMLPFTPRAKDNLAAWMVARNDGKEYGKLAVYRFPKDKLIFGPKQVIGRINQDAEVSRQISLWDQRGSQVIQGPLLVIPIEESLVYVRPLYLKAESGKIPELKRVIVAYDNKIAMEETLEKSLAKIFNGYQTAPTETLAGKPQPETKTSKTATATETTDTSKDALLQQASDAYEAAISAQKNGDWTKYGEEIKKLGEILQKLR